MELSICIPTFNRSEELAKTLESARGIEIPPVGVELLIVDNNSTDTTRDVVEARVADFPFPLRYVFEGKQGANRARNAGIRAARGRIVAFMDDDVEIAPRWANAMLQAFRETGAAAIGGKTWLVYPASRPEWIRADDEDWLSRVDLGLQRTQAGPKQLCSCNLGFDRAWLERVGDFREDLGRVGSCLLSNDETELMERLVAAGGQLYYDPAPMVGHRVSIGRLQRRWFWRRIYWQGRGDVRSRTMSSRMRFNQLLRSGQRLAKVFAGLLWRCLKNGPRSATVYERMAWLSFCSGEMWECLAGPRFRALSTGQQNAKRE